MRICVEWAGLSRLLWEKPEMVARAWEEGFTTVESNMVLGSTIILMQGDRLPKVDYEMVRLACELEKGHRQRHTAQRVVCGTHGQ